MSAKEKPKSKKSNRLHPRNKLRGRYDFKALIAHDPRIADYVVPNKYGEESIDFFNPQAVRLLNRALLEQHYSIQEWDFPEGYLCPPIPGRADYIHYAADILSPPNPIIAARVVPRGSKIKCLDIGTGANCIYPILGVKEYDWSFVASDIDPTSIESAQKILKANPELAKKIELRLQPKANDIFKGLIQEGELFDLTVCNPPFHSSPEEVLTASLRKVKTQKKKSDSKAQLSFGGTNNELWCEGGESAFVQNMIEQSKVFESSVFWFTCLISKQSHLKNALEILKESEAAKVQTIPMGQGNKASHILAWTFLKKEQRRRWILKREMASNE